jgi:hypothetical protein
MTTTPTQTLDTAIDALIAQLREHESAAATIRAQLRDVRKRIAASGRRAGPAARSGRRKRATATTDATPATPPSAPLPLDALDSTMRHPS